MSDEDVEDVINVVKKVVGYYKKWESGIYVIDRDHHGQRWLKKDT